MRFKDEAEKSRIVREGVQKDSAPGEAAARVRLADILQDVGFDLRIFHVPLHVANYLDGHLAILPAVIRKHHPAEGAIAQQLGHPVSRV